MPSRGDTGARARPGAERAAKTDAKRNLLGLMEGLSIESKVFIRDHAVDSDVIIESVKGRLRRARQVGETTFHADGSAEVVMEIDVTNVFSG